MSGPYITQVDAEAYGAYAYFCGARRVPAWTLERWLLMTERDVAFHFDRWATLANRDKNKPLPDNAPRRDEFVNSGEERLAGPDGRLAMSHALSSSDRLKLYDLRQQASGGQNVTVGYLRASRSDQDDPFSGSDATLDSTPVADSWEAEVVRRQTTPISRRDLSPLTARTCNKCRSVRPIQCFARQGKGHRAVCKECDNQRRRGNA